MTGIVTKNSPTDQILFGARQLDFVLLSNWGHSNMIGLTGFEILEGIDTVIPIKQSNISCSVQGENTFRLSKLINNFNITDNSENMWWTPYSFDEEITIRVAFDSFKYISGR